MRTALGPPNAKAAKKPAAMAASTSVPRLMPGTKYWISQADTDHYQQQAQPRENCDRGSGPTTSRSIRGAARERLFLVSPASRCAERSCVKGLVGGRRHAYGPDERTEEHHGVVRRRRRTDLSATRSKPGMTATKSACAGVVNSMRRSIGGSIVSGWRVLPLAARPLHGAARGIADHVARQAGMNRVGRLVRDGVLDHDRLGPRQPVVQLGGERIIAGDHPHRNAERAQVQGVDAGLGDRAAADLDEDRARVVRMPYDTGG